MSFHKEFSTMGKNPIPMLSAEFSKYAGMDATFFKDVSDLYFKKRTGNWTPYLFTGENYAQWEKELPFSNNYYLYQAEIDIINRYAGYFQELAHSLRIPNQPLIALELGPGSAAQHKTIPFLQAIGADIYRGYDSSIEAAFLSRIEVAKALPNIIADTSVTADFNKMALKLPESEGRRFMFCFGGTLGNVEAVSGDDDLPAVEILSALVHYRRHLNTGDMLFIGWDHNQDKASLHACYSDPIHDILSKGVLQRVSNELPLIGEYRPEAHVREIVWNPRNSLLTNSFRIIEKNSFSILGRDVELNKMDLLSYSNSYKPPKPFLEGLYPYAQFKVKDILPDQKIRMHMHALQAV
jgi:hypothetical protein